MLDFGVLKKIHVKLQEHDMCQLKTILWQNYQLDRAYPLQPLHAKRMYCAYLQSIKMSNFSLIKVKLRYLGSINQSYE